MGRGVTLHPYINQRRAQEAHGTFKTMIHTIDTDGKRLKFWPSLNTYTVKGCVWLEIRKDEGDMWGIYCNDDNELVFGSNQLDTLKAIILLMA